MKYIIVMQNNKINSISRYDSKDNFDVLYHDESITKEKAREIFLSTSMMFSEIYNTKRETVKGVFEGL